MYEDKSDEKDNVYLSEKERVLAWTKDVAASTAKEAPDATSLASQPKPRHIERESPRVIVNQIVTTPAVVVTRTRQESNPGDEISAKAVIGTVLGATAGAVIAYGTCFQNPLFLIRTKYQILRHDLGGSPSDTCTCLTGNTDRGIRKPAMTKSQTDKSHVERPKRTAQRVIEAPITYELVQRENVNYVHEHSWASSKPSHHAIATPAPLTRSRADDLIPRSEHPNHSSHTFPRSHVEVATNPPHITKITVAGSGHLRASHASSHKNTARQSDLIPITEVRSAKDLPLPHSRVTSLATDGREDNRASQSSVSPKESVSQLSTRRSGGSGREGSGRSNHGRKNHDEGGHKSRTSRK